MSDYESSYVFKGASITIKAENMDMVISTEEAILKVEDEIVDQDPYSICNIQAFCNKKRIFLELLGKVVMSIKEGSGEKEELQKLFQKIKIL
jgi:hypothetical protein